MLPTTAAQIAQLASTSSIKTAIRGARESLIKFSSRRIMCIRLPLSAAAAAAQNPYLVDLPSPGMSSKEQAKSRHAEISSDKLGIVGVAIKLGSWKAVNPACSMMEDLQQGFYKRKQAV